MIAPGDTVDSATLDGLLLGGGVDVNPRLYGEKPHLKRKSQMTHVTVWSKPTRGALRRDLPILAICRGMQMLNVAKGGSLEQHIHNHVSRPEDKSLPAHAVQVESRSQLASIYGSNALQVNSRHHQAVARLGRGLRAVARAEDGTVEAIEGTERAFVVGVQWHPEDMAACDEKQKRLFDEFVHAASQSQLFH